MAELIPSAPVAIDTTPPCGCPSLYSHLPTCLLTHPEIALLPEAMCDGVKVLDAGPYVEARIGTLGKLMMPDEARAFARALLLAAHVAERGSHE